MQLQTDGQLYVAVQVAVESVPTLRPHALHIPVGKHTPTCNVDLIKLTREVQRVLSTWQPMLTDLRLVPYGRGRHFAIAPSSEAYLAIEDLRNVFRNFGFPICPPAYAMAAPTVPTHGPQRRSLLPVLLLSAAVLLVSELGRAFQAPPAPRTAVAPPSRVATPPLEAAPFAGKSTPVYEVPAAEGTEASSLAIVAATALAAAAAAESSEATKVRQASRDASRSLFAMAAEEAKPFRRPKWCTAPRSPERHKQVVRAMGNQEAGPSSWDLLDKAVYTIGRNDARSQKDLRNFQVGVQILDGVEDKDTADFQVKGELVSRVHAAVLQDVNGQRFLVDLKSTQGTFLDSKRVGKSYFHPTFLTVNSEGYFFKKDGDQISFTKLGYLNAGLLYSGRHGRQTLGERPDYTVMRWTAKLDKCLSDACNPERTRRRALDKCLSDACNPERTWRRALDKCLSDACNPERTWRRALDKCLSDPCNPERTWRRAVWLYGNEIARDSRERLLNCFAPAELGGLRISPPQGLDVVFTTFQCQLAAMYLQRYKHLAKASIRKLASFGFGPKAVFMVLGSVEAEGSQPPPKKQRTVEKSEEEPDVEAPSSGDPMAALYGDLPEAAVVEAPKVVEVKRQPLPPPAKDPTKVIFLDIDGVLRPLHSRQDAFQNTRTIDIGGAKVPLLGSGEAKAGVDFWPSAMRALRFIVQKTEARIVLSSDWRKSDELKEGIQNAFEEHDIPALYSQTPDLDQATPGALRSGARDSEVFLDPDREFVKTNPIVGLTMDIAKLVICYINGTEPSEDLLTAVFGEPSGTT
eukprot:s7_g12.t1